MISRIYAVALLMFRSAVRARLLISLTVLLVAVLLSLPLALRGDGSLAGTVQIMMRYVLAISLFIVGVATLWISCGGISCDIEQKVIHLVTTKPVRPLELWAGKWLGIFGLNVILVGLIFGVLFLSLKVRLASFPAEGDERQRVSREVLQPHASYRHAPEDFSAEVEARLAPMRLQGALPRGVQLAHVKRTLLRRVTAEHSTVAPGQTREWTIALDRAVPDGVTAHLAVELIPPPGRIMSGEGTWRIYRNDVDASYVVSGNIFESRRMALPAELVSRPGVLRLHFTNDESGPLAVTALFDMLEPVALKIQQSSFTANYLKTMLIVMLQMAGVSALGLLAGSCFSFPVATFAAAAALSLAFLSRAFVHSQNREISISLEDIPEDPVAMYVGLLGEKLIGLIDTLIGPALHSAPLEALSTGGFVSWSQVGSTAGFLLLVYTVLAWLLSGFLLSRRELAVAGG